MTKQKVKREQEKRTGDQGQKKKHKVLWKGNRDRETMGKRDSITEAPTRYRTWSSHYQGECATDYTTGDKSGDTRG